MGIFSSYLGFSSYLELFARAWSFYFALGAFGSHIELIVRA